MFATRVICTLSLGFILAGCGGPGDNATVPQAQPVDATQQTIGDHVVHFSAITTDQLQAEIAAAYNITRSKSRAMLNVAILRADTGKPVPGNVTVNTSNLTGQVKNVTMRRINEQEAIYYIGVTPVANQEMLIFDLSIQPEGDDTAHEVKFRRKFYTD